MATIKTRLEKLETQFAHEIPADVRDPKLVKGFREIFGADVPLEVIPCGISAMAYFKNLIASLSGNIFTVKKQNRGSQDEAEN